MILDVRKIKDEVLFKKCSTVLDTEFGPELEKLLSDMLETMYASRGAGLAAPQIGETKRILVADLGHASGEEYGTRSIKMVNPVLVEKSDNLTNAEEGCLSYPGLPTWVVRSEDITISYQDVMGQHITNSFSGLEARIIQHEMDHLDGITLFSRSSNFKKSNYLKKVNKVIAKYHESVARL